jgi:hypothetical protein
LDKSREDAENARFKVEDVERSYKNRIADLERELRISKDRVSDLERDLVRERDQARDRDREKAYSNVRGGNKKKDRNFDDDDYRADDRDYYDHQRESYDDRRDKYNNYEDDWKGNKKEPERAKNDYYDRGYQERGYSERNERNYQEKGFPDRAIQERVYEPCEKKPEKISEQVKARVGAANSSSVSSVLNWGEKPKKNDEILNMENKIFQLQTEKKRFEDELSKIPEHGKKIALNRRREEIENELSNIHSTIANLKIKVKQLQAKEN